MKTYYKNLTTNQKQLLGFLVLSIIMAAILMVMAMNGVIHFDKV
jgi:hypothetical protein